MFQRTASQSGFRAWLLGCMAIAFAVMSCCPPLLTTGKTGKNCTCAKAEKRNIAIAKDFHTHSLQENLFKSKKERLKD